MADFVWLKAEIAKPAYTGMDDATIAATINAAVFDDSQDIRPQDAREAMIFTSTRDWGELTGVVNGIITGPTITVAVRKAANSVYELFKPGTETFDATTAQKWTRFSAMLTDLITAGVITAASQTALTALRTISRPLWYPFGREVEPPDVAFARVTPLAQLQAMRAAGG